MITPAVDVKETIVPGPAGRIAVVDHGGGGPDILLCHGANRTLLDWEPPRLRLAGFRPAAYDLRGHGHSDAPTEGDLGILDPARRAGVLTLDPDGIGAFFTSPVSSTTSTA